MLLDKAQREKTLQALPLRVFGIMQNDTLLAIPFFTFMGLILERSGMAEDLLDTIGQLFGPLRGGLAVFTQQLASMLEAGLPLVAALRDGGVTAFAVDHVPVAAAASARYIAKARITEVRPTPRARPPGNSSTVGLPAPAARSASTRSGRTGAHRPRSQSCTTPAP